MRATYHLAVLVLLAVMTLGGVGARWNPDVRPAVAGRPATVSSSIPTLLAGTGMLAAGQPAVNQATAPEQPALPAVGDPPKAPPPRWVQNFRATELFAGPEPNAASLGPAAQFTTFQLVDVAESGRARLFDPGRGVGRLPGYVWANPQDFGPAGPPQPEFELATGMALNPLTQRPIPERVGNTWPRVPAAEGAVILDGDSGAILYGKNAHVSMAPASLTKILTAIVAIERGKAQDRVRIDVDSRTMYDNTVMGLTPGETVSLEALLYGLMLPSGNDAALAIARHLAGSDARFTELMNDKVRALGLEHSSFRNPHGWDEDGHVSSAYDLAMMARHGMQDPLFYSLSASRAWEGEGYSLWNLNRLLGQYPGADGVKVGYTDNAGRCLVASATRNGRRVFVTVMRSNDPTGESRMLLDYAFQNFRWQS